MEGMLAVRDLKKTYAASGGRQRHSAVEDVGFDIPKGQFFTLLGPSGCGKTTTLQCIAGLEQATSGTIEMAGETVFSSSLNIHVPANDRKIGMIFQSYAVWPHMTVYDNVAFPLIRGPIRIPADEVRRRVMGALDLVKLADLASRPSPMLSGGQQQRVALARAIVHEPRLLLLDEPLSNLDALLRDAMRSELRQLVKDLGITTMFVTHDQVEAMAMSDTVAVMNAGRIVQRGSPRDIYLAPQSAFIAEFLGRSNLIPGRLSAARAKQGCVVETAMGQFSCMSDPGLAPGSEVFLVFRQLAPRVAGTQSTAGNNFVAQIERTQFLGDAIELEAKSNGVALRIVLDPYMAPRIGDTLAFELPADRCVVVRRPT